MPVECQKQGDKYRIVKSENGEIETNEAGSPVDGGGHDSESDCGDQARAINAALNANQELLGFKASVGQVRRETFQGREHLVVPVVALTEGVLRPMNSSEPELALSQEFSPTAPAWNGKPVVVNHPKKNGQLVSANSPDIWESSVIGQIFNADAQEDKLKMEAWIDEAKANELGGTTAKTVQALADGQLMEVSTGLFAKTEQQSGSHDGKKFNGIWRDILPDHLAILEEGATGACSVEDGCGAPRMNQEGDCGCQEGGGSEGRISRFLSTIQNLFGNRKMNDVTRQEALQNALDKKGIDGFVMAVEDGGTFVHDEFGKDGRLRFVRRSFDISDGRVNIGDKAEEVRRETLFTRTHEEKMSKEKKVQALIDNEATPFTEDHRDNLMAFEEGTLDEMAPKEQEEKPQEKEAQPTDNAASQPVDFNTLLANADPEVQEAIRHGKEMFQNEKEQLINHITACSRNSFTKEQLGAKPFDELRNIAALVQEPADFSARGGPRMNTQSDGGIPTPPSVFEKTQ